MQPEHLQSEPHLQLAEVGRRVKCLANNTLIITNLRHFLQVVRSQQPLPSVHLQLSPQLQGDPSHPPQTHKQQFPVHASPHLQLGPQAQVSGENNIYYVHGDSTVKKTILSSYHACKEQAVQQFRPFHVSRQSLNSVVFDRSTLHFQNSNRTQKSHLSRPKTSQALRRNKKKIIIVQMTMQPPGPAFCS